ncbi:hypothetical protein HPB50_029623 [Hyalomma asiaticum]|nr:hypothetical protein HPB50_029623 [Hyalomma asiaticum]
MTSCWDAVREQQQQRRQLVSTSSNFFQGAELQALPPRMPDQLPERDSAGLGTSSSDSIGMTSCWDAVRDQQQQRRQLVSTSSNFFQGAELQALPPRMPDQLPGDRAARIPSAISQRLLPQPVNLCRGPSPQAAPGDAGRSYDSGVHPFAVGMTVDYINSPRLPTVDAVSALQTLQHGSLAHLDCSLQMQLLEVDAPSVSTSSSALLVMGVLNSWKTQGRRVELQWLCDELELTKHVFWWQGVVPLSTSRPPRKPTPALLEQRGKGGFSNPAPALHDQRDQDSWKTQGRRVELQWLCDELELTKHVFWWQGVVPLSTSRPPRKPTPALLEHRGKGGFSNPAPALHDQRDQDRFRNPAPALLDRSSSGG